eukprot:767137-Hanusia_phi.AAC.24
MPPRCADVLRPLHDMLSGCQEGWGESTSHRPALPARSSPVSISVKGQLSTRVSPSCRSIPPPSGTPTCRVVSARSEWRRQRLVEARLARDFSETRGLVRDHERSYCHFRRGGKERRKRRKGGEREEEEEEELRLLIRPAGT